MKIIVSVIFCICFFVTSLVNALNHDYKSQKNLSILEKYIRLNDHITKPMTLVKITKTKFPDVFCYTYELISQYWPQGATGETPHAWRHKLNIYKPYTVKHETALLFINGGTRNLAITKNNPPPANLNFAKIAHESHSIVVDLQDIPNQYLRFKDGIFRKEDGIIAYTWRKFLDNPDKYIYFPLHLPMTKAVVRAMDAVQDIALKKYKIHLTNFVIAGASKRGWAAWLTALADSRVSAIAPIVIDILNTKKNILHTYHRYGNNWPIAFHDYVAEGVTDRINTDEFARLMQIEDPLAYLEGPNGQKYRDRLSIPKYIISASGDDFFVPDSLKLFINELPGDKPLVRVVPNQSHYIDMNIVSDALFAWYSNLFVRYKLPKIYWQDDKKQVVTSICFADEITLWRAFAANCDFRLNSGVKYSSQGLLMRIGKGNKAYYDVPSANTNNSCVASFVEAKFVGCDHEYKAPITFTTPVKVEGRDLDGN